MESTERFTDKAGGYSKYRPSYPAALYDYLYDSVGFAKSSVIADVGAGTGKFSHGMLERGSIVYCVEPNYAMRREAVAFLCGYRNFNLVDGTAENTTLDDSQVDFVTTAQAFHWFDHKKFHAECKRILRPDGKVALVWNKRDMNDEMVRKMQSIKRKFNAHSGTERMDDAECEKFFSGEFEYREFDNAMLMTRERFVGECLSSSYAPRENERRYRPFVDALVELFEDRSAGGLLTMPLVAKIYVGTV